LALCGSWKGYLLKHCRSDEITPSANEYLEASDYMIEYVEEPRHSVKVKWAANDLVARDNDRNSPERDWTGMTFGQSKKLWTSFLMSSSHIQGDIVTIPTKELGGFACSYWGYEKCWES